MSTLGLAAVAALVVAGLVTAVLRVRRMRRAPARPPGPRTVAELVALRAADPGPTAAGPVPSGPVPSGPAPLESAPAADPAPGPEPAAETSAEGPEPATAPPTTPVPADALPAKRAWTTVAAAGDPPWSRAERMTGPRPARTDGPPPADRPGERGSGAGRSPWRRDAATWLVPSTPANGSGPAADRAPDGERTPAGTNGHHRESAADRDQPPAAAVGGSELPPADAAGHAQPSPAAAPNGADRVPVPAAAAAGRESAPATAGGVDRVPVASVSAGAGGESVAAAVGGVDRVPATAAAGGESVAAAGSGVDRAPVVSESAGAGGESVAAAGGSADPERVASAPAGPEAGAAGSTGAEQEPTRSASLAPRAVPAQAGAGPDSTRPEPARPLRLVPPMSGGAGDDLAVLARLGLVVPGAQPAPVLAPSGVDSQGTADVEPVGAAQPVRFRVGRGDGTAVPGAGAVLLDSHGRRVATGYADAQGCGELRGPHPGRYLLLAVAPEHQPGATTLSIMDGTAEASVLVVRSAVLTGSVRGPHGPVVAARLTLVQDGEIVDYTRTDSVGAYRLADLAAGGYALSVSAPGCVPVAVRVELADGAALHRDVELTRDGQGELSLVGERAAAAARQAVGLR